MIGRDPDPWLTAKGARWGDTVGKPAEHGLKSMKFRHTSDWHLGRSLYGRKRYDEFTRFLDWLVLTP